VEVSHLSGYPILMNICYPNDFQGFDDIKKVFRFVVEHSVGVIKNFKFVYKVKHL
jgi:hypothetical protein